MSSKVFVKSDEGKIQIFCHYDELADPRKLKLHADNDNQHPAKQIKMFKKIFVGNGFRRSITVSRRSGMVTKGNGATVAAIALGMDKVPIEYQDYKNRLN